jgi:hypothetical protein
MLPHSGCQANGCFVGVQGAHVMSSYRLVLVLLI